jgi:hypothetical protein
MQQKRVLRTMASITLTFAIAGALTVAPTIAAQAKPAKPAPAGQRSTHPRTPARTTTSTALPFTRSHRVRPVDSQSRLRPAYAISARVKGSCFTTSSFQPRAWRCIANNFIHDPCWRKRGQVLAVVCVGRPWERHVVRIRVHHLPSTDSGKARYWGLRLRAGPRCVGSSGAHDVFHGRAVNYFCRGGWVLLGRPDRSEPLWTIHTARRVHGHYRDRGVKALSDAWFARPDPQA